MKLVFINIFIKTLIVLMNHYDVFHENVNAIFVGFGILGTFFYYTRRILFPVLSYLFEGDYFGYD